MMRQMRENTKWIMLATALAFVALMVFEWGMDITGQSAGGLGEIGEVNGIPVMYEDYQATYRQLYEQAQAGQEEPLTSQQNRDLEDAAFDQMVNRILIQEELQRRGIAVSDEEIRQAAQFSPPPEIRQIFRGEEGFDLQQYQQYISSPNADEQILLYLESYFRDAIPRAKLLRQVSSGLYLTDQELWRRWRDQNEAVEVRYVAFDPSDRIPDEEISVTEEEIRDYYEENQEEFEVPAQATLRAVVLPKTPTPADTAAMEARAAAVYEQLREGADWAEVAARESADQNTATEGGDLGVVAKGLLAPTLDSTVFTAPVGTVQPPVRTPFGWHVVEVQDRWGQDSVQARHVLIPMQRTDSSEIALLTMADSLEDLGENVSLEEAARTLGLRAIQAQITEEFAVLAGAGQIGEGADWAFEEAAPGDVSPVFENAQAFYSVELLDRTPAGVLPLEQARTPIRETLVMRKKMDRATAEADSLLDAVRSGASLDEASSDAGLEVRRAGPFAREDFVPGLGRRNAAIGTAFGLDEGEVSDVVRTRNNVFVLEKLAHLPADSTEWEAQKHEQRQRILAGLQQERLQEWLQGLRATADIVDRRLEVLRPLEEEPLQQPRGGFGF